MKKRVIVLRMLTFYTVVVFMIGCAENQQDASFVNAYPPNNSSIDADEVITVLFDDTPMTVDVEIHGRNDSTFLWELDGKNLTIRGNTKFNTGRKYTIIITWATGRKILNYTVRTPPPLPKPETPDAAFVSSTPADGGRLVSNSSISVTFDNNPGDVTVSAGTATTSGKTRTIAPPADGFPVGDLALTISWTNGDGEKTLNFTVTAADEDAPEVESSDPEHGDTGVSADLEEVSVTFNEIVTGDLILLDGDDNLNWEQSISGSTITLTRIAGSKLSNETEYTIAGTVMDANGNETEVELTFVTK